MFLKDMYIVISENEVTCYVQDISAVKRAKKNASVQYFNCVLQCEDQNYRSVSYRLDLRERLEAAAEAKSPVKLVNIGKRRSFYDTAVDDIVISKGTNLEENINAPFTYEKVQDIEKEAPVKTIREILDNCHNKEHVSVKVYVNLDGRPVIPVTTRNGVVPKKDVTINDITGMMRLTIWGEKVEDLKCSGVYKIINANVNEYPTGVFSIQSNFKTQFVTVEDNIQPTNATLAELSSFQVSFPPDSCNITRSYFCSKCKQRSQESSKVFKCSSCGTMVLVTKSKSDFTARLTFSKEADRSQFVVTVFGSQLPAPSICPVKLMI